MPDTKTDPLALLQAHCAATLRSTVKLYGETSPADRMVIFLEFVRQASFAALALADSEPGFDEIRDVVRDTAAAFIGDLAKGSDGAEFLGTYTTT